MYKSFDEGIKTKELDCGVAELVKYGALRWFRHVKIRNVDDFVISVLGQD